MDFENFVASIVREKFQQIDEEAADAREQQGIAQVGLGTRPMSDRPGLAKEEDEVKTTTVSVRVDDALKGTPDNLRELELPMISKLELEGETFVLNKIKLINRCDDKCKSFKSKLCLTEL